MALGARIDRGALAIVPHTMRICPWWDKRPGPTVRRGCLREMRTAAATWIERVPQCICQEVDTQDGGKDARAGEDHQPGTGVQVAKRVGEHVSPARVGRLDAKLNEADPGLGHDSGGKSGTRLVDPAP